jgi:hypothetical protein
MVAVRVHTLTVAITANCRFYTVQTAALVLYIPSASHKIAFAADS